jgi:hypothetical protein
MSTPKGTMGMPGPGSTKAPSFNGETSELLEFFEIFEDLALSYSLMDEQKCKMIVWYTDPLTKKFWVTLTGYESKDYGALKQSILAKYPKQNEVRDICSETWSMLFLTVQILRSLRKQNSINAIANFVLLQCG